MKVNEMIFRKRFLFVIGTYGNLGNSNGLRGRWYKQ
jgi:hypothetical protein